MHMYTSQILEQRSHTYFYSFFGANIDPPQLVKLGPT
jgi:hypothetical protein